MGAGEIITPESARGVLPTATPRALGVRIRCAPTHEERAAAGRTLIALRKRIVIPCEFCGAIFETYANGTVGVGRFCSKAHQRRAYYQTHREQEREWTRQARERQRAAKLDAKVCVRCGMVISHSRRAVYCSQTCRQRTYIERRRERSQGA